MNNSQFYLTLLGATALGQSRPGSNGKEMVLHIPQITKARLDWCGLVSWHINHCGSFNAKSIFIHINSSVSNNLD